jgi:putative tryptophan/tyrosine transport system substrate-binding protein
VEYGLVSSLARPIGNITGVTSLTAEVNAKRLDLLHELVPTASLIALIANPLVASPQQGGARQMVVSPPP